MLTYDNAQFTGGSKVSRALARAEAGASGVYFWIPALAFIAALFVIQHDFKYASFALADTELQGDLVAEVGASHASRQASFLALAALGLASLASNSGSQLRLDWRILGCLIGLGCWTMVSALWADDVALSLKRSLPPLFTLLAACGIAKAWKPGQVMLFTAVATSTFLLVAVAAECATGAFLRGGDYQFAGTLHPNDQGVNCAMLCLAALCLSREGLAAGASAASRRWLLLCLTGAGFVVLTGSRTATLSLAAGLMTFWTLGSSGYQKLLMRLGVVTMGLCVGVVLVEADADSTRMFADLATMGREQDQQTISSLTGRIPIWGQVLNDVAAAPLSGYGYGGFWTPQRVLDYSYILGWEFTHAHSAYFETLLNVGAIGLGLGLFVVLCARRTAIQAFAAKRDSGCRFVAAVLTMALVHGLLDSNFVRDGLAPTVSLLCIASMAFQHGKADPV